MDTNSLNKGLIALAIIALLYNRKPPPPAL